MSLGLLKKIGNVKLLGCAEVPSVSVKSPTVTLTSLSRMVTVPVVLFENSALTGALAAEVSSVIVNDDGHRAGDEVLVDIEVSGVEGALEHDLEGFGRFGKGVVHNRQRQLNAGRAGGNGGRQRRADRNIAVIVDGRRRRHRGRRR